MIGIIIIILSGISAGLVTGLIGLSAVNVVAPLLIIFLGYPIYPAIGMALGIDFFASFSSSYIYSLKKNIDWKVALTIVIFSIIGIGLGSYFGAIIPSKYLMILVGIGISLTGINLFKKGYKKQGENLKENNYLHKHKKFFIFLGSIIIGLIAGFFGSGGGVSILILLVSVFGFKIHRAIGTSVFAMTFIALLGAFAHYIQVPFSIHQLLLAGGFAVLSSAITSVYSHELNEFHLKKLSGSIIFILGFMLLIKEIFSLSF